MFNTLLRILEDGAPDGRAGTPGRLQEDRDHHHDLQPRDAGHREGVYRLTAARDDAVTYEKMKETVTEELKRSFRRSS